jgi:hypothetical protein
VNNPHSTAPKPYTCALGDWQPKPVALYQVIDTSDGDAVVDTFRNPHLADKKAALSPAYRVREFILKPRNCE